MFNNNPIPDIKIIEEFVNSSPTITIPLKVYEELLKIFKIHDATKKAYAPSTYQSIEDFSHNSVRNPCIQTQSPLPMSSNPYTTGDKIWHNNFSQYNPPYGVSPRDLGTSLSMSKFNDKDIDLLIEHELVNKNNINTSDVSVTAPLVGLNNILKNLDLSEEDYKNIKEYLKSSMNGKIYNYPNQLEIRDYARRLKLENLLSSGKFPKLKEYYDKLQNKNIFTEHFISTLESEIKVLQYLERGYDGKESLDIMLGFFADLFDE